jgi:hypothetical protein
MILIAKKGTRKMNALELADLLEVDSWYKLITREEIATMLRQQHGEEIELKERIWRLEKVLVKQRAEIEALKAKTLETDCYGDGNVYRGVRSKDSEVKTYAFDEHAGKQVWSNPAKTLTDEEILEEWVDEPLNFDGEKEIIDFARAILRKVQEADKIESLGTVNIGGVHFRNGKEVK